MVWTAVAAARCFHAYQLLCMGDYRYKRTGRGSTIGPAWEDFVETRVAPEQSSIFTQCLLNGRLTCQRWRY